jgi:hypothetical protein
MEQGKVRLYGCGGLGTNIVKDYIGRQPAPGFAITLPSFIDTSRSNLAGIEDEKTIYVLDKTDGSGKVRKENHAQISAAVKQILLQQPPEDFNIVVFSASGGSGSVIGPLLAKELLARGHSVVVCLAGSSESTITAQNTLNTLKSLSAISKQIDTPVVMFYRHNGGECTRSVVDGQLNLAISSLCYLTSRQNDELDTKDVANWLRFNHSTSVPAQLALLDIFSAPEQVASITDPITIASLYSDRDQPHLEEPIPEYPCTGYFTTKIDGIPELHLVVSTENLDATYEKLNGTLEKFIQRREGRAAAIDLVGNAATTDDGLVL